VEIVLFFRYLSAAGGNGNFSLCAEAQYGVRTPGFPERKIPKRDTYCSSSGLSEKKLKKIRSFCGGAKTAAG